MKIWQVAACLTSEQSLFDEYLGHIDLAARGRDEMEEAKVLEIFSKIQIICIGFRTT
jgi:hypothetical protein